MRWVIDILLKILELHKFKMSFVLLYAANYRFLLGENPACDLQHDLQNSKIITLKIHFVRIFT